MTTPTPHLDARADPAPGSAALELDRLGDDLERAATRHLARSRTEDATPHTIGRSMGTGSASPPRRLSVRRIGLALAALTVVATGTAVAAGIFSPAQVAKGMPAGAAIFGETDPSCTLDADGSTYHCTLDRAPAPEVSDFTGTKELIGIDGKVAGGCIGQDPAGMHWDCFVGEDAVRHEILVEDLLGEPMLAPGRG